jgi:hypothetical protein
MSLDTLSTHRWFKRLHLDGTVCIRMNEDHIGQWKGHLRAAGFWCERANFRTSKMPSQSKYLPQQTFMESGRLSTGNIYVVAHKV